MDDEFDDDNIDWAAIDLPDAPINSQNATASHHVQQIGHATVNCSYSAHTNAGSTSSSANPSTQSLQQQIAHLQNLLASKSSRISELESTVASTAETHRAELEAHNRIHLVEEELRRAKREADQYKSQWVRAKKQLDNKGDTSRSITPSNVDHFHNHFGEDNIDGGKEIGNKKMKGVKRKSEENEYDKGQDEEKNKSSVVSALVTPRVVQGHDSISIRLAKHLLLLDEMGRYALGSLISNNGKEVNSSIETNKVSVTHHSTAPPDEPQYPNIAPQRTDDKVVHDTKSFVNSILCHMIADPVSTIDHHLPTVMSVSELTHVLLEKFNTLFHDCTDTNRQSSMDIDISVNQKQNNLTVYSWRAVLYLLHVLHDILSLSAKARDDLRWWFYHARQSIDSGDFEMNTTQRKADCQDHPRIDGLPSKAKHTPNIDRNEALWNSSCRSNSNEGYSWDSSTMTLPCNLFYSLLVKLMKGPQARNGPKRCTQLAQIKAIELVSCLMSDASPYNHVESSTRNKTPYLWKFWFDSLFPSYSTSLASGISDTVDFFTLWEKSSHQKNFLGSGRRYYTQLNPSYVKNEAQPAKQSGGKQSSKVDKAKSNPLSMEKQDSDCLITDIKCKSLQLLIHFISSSSSVHQTVYQAYTSSKSKADVSLSKRVLYVILDELDETIVPTLTSRRSTQPLDSLGYCINLCQSCVHFLLVMSRSDAGIHLLRIKTKLDVDAGEVSRWSLSGIGCVTAVLEGVLSQMTWCQEQPTAAIANVNCFSMLKMITEQCIQFYKNILSFVHNQDSERSKSKTSFLAMVSERRSVFISCCRRINDMQTFSEEAKQEARLLMEEVLLDEEE